MKEKFLAVLWRVLAFFVTTYFVLFTAAQEVKPFAPADAEQLRRKAASRSS